MKILFQGDSITDAGRERNDPHHLGEGFAKFVAEKIVTTFPHAAFEFINLGISGNRSDQLLARWQSDAIDLQPDIISVLVGINDVFHRYYIKENRPKNSDEQIEANYRALLVQLREKTNAKIVIMAPFFLDCFEQSLCSSLVDTDEMTMQQDMVRVQDIVRKLATEYADAYVPLDEYFSEALRTQPEPRYYSKDSIHPTPQGVELIGNAYLEAVLPLIKQFLQNEC